MPLSCDCSSDFDVYFIASQEYSIYSFKRRRRCKSCSDLININSLCLEIRRFTTIDEYDDKYLGMVYYCEKCADIYFNLQALGYCTYLNDNMKYLLKEYQLLNEKKT